MSSSEVVQRYPPPIVGSSILGLPSAHVTCLSRDREAATTPKGNSNAGQAPALSLRQLFKEQQRLLNGFFDNLSHSSLQCFCELCLACAGRIYFTGVGKSGFVAQSISQILVSVGIDAAILNPTDALHGDLGTLSPADIVVFLSKSGATEELLRLVPFVKAKTQLLKSAQAKGARLVAVTCTERNPLAASCSFAVHLPLERELCPFNLAPVTSTAVQLAFGNTLAVALMQARGLTQDDYARNHPAGRIGRRLTLRVADVMVTGPGVPLVGPAVRIVDALGELSAKGLGCLLVVGERRQLLGTFTDGDLRRALQARGAQVMETRVEEVMHSQPRVCSATMMAANVMQDMERPPRKVSFFPVLQGDEVVGLVTLHGLVSAGL